MILCLVCIGFIAATDGNGPKAFVIGVNAFSVVINALAIIVHYWR